MAKEAKSEGNAVFTAGNFSDAIALSPMNYVLYSNRSAAYASLNRFFEALADAQKTVELNSSWPKGYSRLGAAHLGLNNVEDAIAAYEKGLEIDPNNDALKSGLADARSKTRSASSSGESPFGKIIQGPELWAKLMDDPTTLNYLSQPDFLKMIQDIQKNPNNINMYLGDQRMMNVLGVLLNVKMSGGPPRDEEVEKEKEPERMEEVNEEEKAKKERKVHAQKELGNAAYKKKDFERAIEHYTKALELNDEDISFLTNRAAVYLEMGKVNFRKGLDPVQVVEFDVNGTSSVAVGQTDYEKAYKEKRRGALKESNGQMACKYYSMPGGCKYGTTCKFIHKEKTEAPVELNFLGLPIRPGKKECAYYMSTGSCKHSTNCRLHHPNPTAVGAQGSSGYQHGGSPQPYASAAQPPVTPWPLQQIPNAQVPYLDTSPSYSTGFFLPPQGLHPNSESSGYLAPVNPLYPAEMNMPQPPSASPMEDGRKGNVQDGKYPERPGQPECQFFMKTGACKFKSACKYHHPKSHLPKTSDVILSPVDLPLRPDKPVCTHFSRHGICKYGRSCRYNHPMDHNPFAPPAAFTVSPTCFYRGQHRSGGGQNGKHSSSH